MSIWESAACSSPRRGWARMIVVERKGRDSNPHTPSRGFCASNAARPTVSGSRSMLAVASGSSNPPDHPIRVVESVVVASREVELRGHAGEALLSSTRDWQSTCDRGGSRTHTPQALNLPALPVGLPGRTVADRGVEPRHRAYEARLSAGPSAILFPVVMVGFEPTLSTV